MSLPVFLSSLLSANRVRVGSVVGAQGKLVPATDDELSDAQALLEEFETDYRADLAHQAPSIAVPSLLWAAEHFYRACSLLIHRDIDAETLLAILAEPCPEAPSASVCYSVDLTFRFLPDLMRMARALSSDDPLVHKLTEWAQQWPLSSVGIANIPIGEPGVLLDDACLRQLYVDRIIAEQDTSRLEHGPTREAVLEALGGHRELAPKLAARLTTQ